MNISGLLNLANKYYKLASEKDTDSGAGILFTCEEDGTVLLILRSSKVKHPNVWGVPGGGVRREGEDNIHETDLEGAKREVVEELGSLPSSMEYVTTAVQEEKDFTYTTYVYNLTLKEKLNWTKNIKLNWENSQAKWFKKDQIPSNLHYGIPALNNLLSEQGLKTFELPPLDARENRLILGV